MAMTMIYIWLIGAVVSLAVVFLLLRIWYSDDNFEGANRGVAEE